MMMMLQLCTGVGLPGYWVKPGRRPRFMVAGAGAGRGSGGGVGIRGRVGSWAQWSQPAVPRLLRYLTDC